MNIRPPYLSPEKPVCGLEPSIEQQTGSKLGKEYNKAAYCHLAYLTYMQSISCEMLDCMNHKLESRLLGEISTTSDMQMIPLLMSESEEELNSFLMPLKKEREKTGLKHNIKKSKIIASGPITSWQIDGEKWKQWQILLSGAPKSLKMVTAAMKFKYFCSLEEKL